MIEFLGEHALLISLTIGVAGVACVLWMLSRWAKLHDAREDW